jgi:hypothetical protein
MNISGYLHAPAALNGKDTYYPLTESRSGGFGKEKNFVPTRIGTQLVGLVGWSMGR